jgi:hypothetical protein
MEGAAAADLGLVYRKEGLDYYTVLLVKDAKRYEQFVLDLGFTIEQKYPLLTTEEFHAFIKLEQEYRENVWSKMPRQLLH